MNVCFRFYVKVNCFLFFLLMGFEKNIFVRLIIIFLVFEVVFIFFGKDIMFGIVFVIGVFIWFSL